MSQGPHGLMPWLTWCPICMSIGIVRGPGYYTELRARCRIVLDIAIRYFLSESVKSNHLLFIISLNLSIRSWKERERVFLFTNLCSILLTCFYKICSISQRKRENVCLYFLLWQCSSTNTLYKLINGIDNNLIIRILSKLFYGGY